MLGLQRTLLGLRVRHRALSAKLVGTVRRRQLHVRTALLDSIRASVRNQAAGYATLVRLQTRLQTRVPQAAQRVRLGATVLRLQQRVQSVLRDRKPTR